MRNLFLIFLLANVLILGWRYWATPPDVNPYAIRGAAKERELALFTGAAPRARAATAPGGQSAESPVRPDGGSLAAGCVRVGPFADAVPAGTARDSLVRNGWPVTESSNDGQIWLGHWVQIENFGDRAQAEKAAGVLGAGGVADAHIGPTGPPFSISLGVFRERDRADKVVAVAKGLGFAPVVGDRYRTGLEYWLTVRVPAGQGLDLSRLGLDPGQIVRAEPAPCVAAPEPIN